MKKIIIVFIGVLVFLFISVCVMVSFNKDYINDIEEEILDNTDINNIDEALLRPGRCFVNYEFKPLEAEKASKLLESLGHKVDKPREMTLAEIYNYKEEDKLIQKPKKIGF